MSALRIVGIGGGTGLPVLMRGLSQLDHGTHPALLQLTAVASVSDDGGSSGRLRRAFHIPAVGDLRKCLMGFARPDSLLSALVDYRFSGGKELQDHSLGNLILTALMQQTGSVCEATRRLAQALALPGEVLPATEASATICAEGVDGRVARGETAIAGGDLRIARVWLEPDSPPPTRGVIERLLAADVIVLGPGSLYTSVLAPLLVSGVARAVLRSRALRVYVCNLLTQRGETEGFTAADHVRVLTRHLGRGAIDVCVVNTRRPRGRTARACAGGGAALVVPDLAAVRAQGVTPVAADLLAEEGPGVRHRPAALARLVVELARARAVAPLRRTASPRAEVRNRCVGSSAT